MDVWRDACALASHCSVHAGECDRRRVGVVRVWRDVGLKRRGVKDGDAAARCQRVFAGEIGRADSARCRIHSRARCEAVAVNRGDQQARWHCVAEGDFVRRGVARVCENELVLHRIASNEVRDGADGRFVQSEHGLDECDVHIRRRIIDRRRAVRSIVVSQRRGVREDDGVLVRQRIGDLRGDADDE